MRVGDRDVPDEVLTFREGAMWIAAWRRFDVVAQGETEAEAVNRLLRTMGSQCLCDAMDGRRPFEGVAAPPVDVVAGWEAKHQAEHPTTV